MPTVERIENGESFSERAIPSDAVIQFKVLGLYTTKAAVEAVKDPANFGPSGTPHPDDESGRLRSVQYDAVSRIGAGGDRGWIIAVRFGVDGNGANFQAPPVTEPEYTTVEFNSLTKEFQAPYWYREPIARESGGSIVTAYDWSEKFRKFNLNGENLRIVCNVPRSQYLFNSQAYSRGQRDKIHTIGGTQYQYIGYSSSQVAVDVWQVTHEWWADPGNDAVPIPPGLNPSECVASPARLPFHDYESYKIPIIVPGTAPIFIPVIETTKVFLDQPNGWSNLLGQPVQRAEADLS